MSRTRGQRRPRWRSSAPAAGLLPKLLATFLAVLVVSAVVAISLETRLARAELREQTRVLSAEQGLVLDRMLREEQVRTSQSVETLAQVARVGGEDLHVELLKLLRTVRLSNALEIGDVLDATTGEVVATSSSRWRVSSPETPVVEPTQRVAGQRVVPLDEGGFGLVYLSTVDLLGAQPLVLATGYPLDDRRAERLRAAVGADDVEIVVEGEVVASTLGRDGAPSGRWREHGDIQEAVDPDRLVRYVGLALPDAWGRQAAVGLVVADPLAPLDAALARTRLLMGGLLVALFGMLAYGLTRLMTRPLQQLTSTASAIAEGRLESSFDTDRGDEIGTLARALERMRLALRSQLLLIRRQADALQDAARRIVGAQDAERRRLAQDLHDGIQQQLVLLRMEVSLVRARLRQDPARLDDESDAFASRIDHILDELRATGQALFPAILRDRGLGGALFSLAARSSLPFEVDLDPDPLPRMDPEVEAGAYFLISEAVTNALKHARAQQVEAWVRHRDGSLEIEVRDDGTGFEVSEVHASGGLQHMRDRVNALGGTLRVVPTLSEGTRITAVLPLSRQGALEEEQHGGDAPVDLGLLGEPELPEDGVGVLLDRPLGDRQLRGDGEVPLARGHQREDLELPRREPGEP
jgi:signal transduction histidine kinase